jgi:acyl carrier protein
MSEVVSLQLNKDGGVKRLYAVVTEVLGVEVEPDTHFLDLGGDSMDAVIVADIVAEEFGVGPELDSFFICDTVRDIAEKWWDTVPVPAAS